MKRDIYKKGNLYWIGTLLGEDVYLQTYDEKKAEIAERILQKIITDADIKAGNIEFGKL